MKMIRLVTEAQTPEEQLKWLEGDYFDQSTYFRKKDLIKINKLREQLGLPTVGPDLKPIIALQSSEVEQPKAQKTPKIKKDKHPEAKAVYQKYLEIEDYLEPYRTYNKLMINATRPQHGKTPIEPLATMGTDGGEILCDYCQKPILIEGGQYHGMGAGDAWKASNETLKYSYILGGVIFLTEQNGTFRAYHDYSPPCYKAAIKKTDEEKAFFKPEKPHLIAKKMREFLADNIFLDPSSTHTIINTVYGYDPGVGINHP